MAENELISIGLPTYNGLPFIKCALASLSNQTYRNLEIIISDDGSTDGTTEFCRESAKKDKRIKFYHQKKHLGSANNFNFVLKKAKGRYFAWAADDDLWDKNFIKDLYQLVSSSKKNALAMSSFDDIRGRKHYPQTRQKTRHLNRFQSLIYFMKTRDLSLFYGLHLKNSLKVLGGYHQDSRPFFKSSDFLTIFKSLAKGNLVFTNKVLFFKRDTGYHHLRFQIIEGLNFDRKVVKIMARYICFPIYYIYDLVQSLIYISKSDFNLTEKILLSTYDFFSYFKYNLHYIYQIITGFGYLIKGVFKKLSGLAINGE